MSIYFYKITDKYGCFSNFAKYGFELDGKFWETSEHYFQAKKFENTIYEEEIRKAKSPMDAAIMGRDKNKPIRNDWEEVKEDVMKKAVLKKFETHSDIKDILISTGEEEIIEKTTNDYYWGCGKLGNGKNMLGKILMDVRKTLKTNSKE